MAPRTQLTIMRWIVQLPEHSPHVPDFFSVKFDEVAFSALRSMPEQRECNGAGDLDHRRLTRVSGIMEAHR
jgi:hypothetical protein